MVYRSGHCLNRELCEIVVPVKMPGTRNGTKRPREPLLHLSAEFGYIMCRIGRRLRSGYASIRGGDVEILPFVYLSSNPVRGHRLVGSLTGVVAS